MNYSSVAQLLPVSDQPRAWVDEPNFLLQAQQCNAQDRWAKDYQNIYPVPDRKNKHALTPIPL
jgi:hypothetical protein